MKGQHRKKVAAREPTLYRDLSGKLAFILRHGDEIAVNGMRLCVNHLYQRAVLVRGTKSRGGPA
jgi:hypothetical protein